MNPKPIGNVPLTWAHVFPLRFVPSYVAVWIVVTPVVATGVHQPGIVPPNPATDHPPPLITHMTWIAARPVLAPMKVTEVIGAVTVTLIISQLVRSSCIV